MSTLQPWLKYWFTPMPEDPLSWRGARGILRGTHFKGGTNREPEFRLEETGPCSAILHADNAAGQVAAKMGMEHAIKTAQQNGVAVVGISRMGHSGAISYFVQQAARAGFIGISMCQSDPMVVPFGGAEIYYGTNPWPLPRREKATRSLPLIWRLPYRHGKSARRPLA